MSVINITGDFKASNLQIGDNNKQINNLQNAKFIDWELLINGIDAMMGKTDSKELSRCKKIFSSRDKGTVKTYIKNNIEPFINNIVCNFAAGCLIELIKILL